jgi:hypothetical protein
MLTKSQRSHLRQAKKRCAKKLSILMTSSPPVTSAVPNNSPMPIHESAASSHPQMSEVNFTSSALAEQDAPTAEQKLPETACAASSERSDVLAAFVFQDELDAEMAAYEKTLVTKLCSISERVDAALTNSEDRALYRACLAVKGQYQDRIDSYNCANFESNLDQSLLEQHHAWQTLLHKHGLGMCSFYTWWIASAGSEPFNHRCAKFYRDFANYV